MKRAFDPARLFEPWKRDMSIHPYRSVEAELDAVESGKKAMSWFGFLVEQLFERGSGYAELVELAFRRGLVVALTHDTVIGAPFERQWAHVFVARAEQLWRIPALQIVREAQHVDGQSTWGAEMQQSTLLGYTKAQRTKWLTYWKQQVPTRTGLAIYTLLDAEKRTRVRALGQRCFGSGAAIAQMTFFTSGCNLRERAQQIVPRGLTLARSSIKFEPARALFGDFSKRGVGLLRTVRPTETQAVALNEALLTRVQFLTARGWA